LIPGLPGWSGPNVTASRVHRLTDGEQSGQATGTFPNARSARVLKRWLRIRE